MRPILLCAILLLITVAAAEAAPQCVLDNSRTLEQMAASPSPARTVPKDLVIDRRELDFRNKERPYERLYVQRFPLETAEDTGMYLVGEGTALCRVRDHKGDWWLVVDEIGDNLAYLPQGNFETKPAAVSAAERWRRPKQVSTDSTNSVEGTWARCGPWPSSTCDTTYSLVERGRRVCGYYEHIGTNDRVYAGQIAGQRRGNRIDIEYACGRPSGDAHHWCPEDKVDGGYGWDAVPKSLFICEGKLYREGAACSDQLVKYGRKHGPLASRVAQERTKATWLSRCLADDKFPPPELMAPKDSPSKL